MFFIYLVSQLYGIETYAKKYKDYKWYLKKIAAYNFKSSQIFVVYIHEKISSKRSVQFLYLKS